MIKSLSQPESLDPGRAKVEHFFDSAREIKKDPEPEVDYHVIDVTEAKC